MAGIAGRRAPATETHVLFNVSTRVEVSKTPRTRQRSPRSGGFKRCPSGYRRNVQPNCERLLMTDPQLLIERAMATPRRTVNADTYHEHLRRNCTD
jgi:hypothetical protein